ncbi:Ubiquitin Carboxyl-Terminal Hydrolase 16 [Manis pentadactyla]|nr:Ubiquitin Carboxyl-Terminal Hydrolase 16 [Manis pentadactyla]
MQLLCVKLGRQGSLRAAQQAQQPHCLSSYPNCAFTVLCSFPRATGNEQIRGSSCPYLNFFWSSCSWHPYIVHYFQR